MNEIFEKIEIIQGDITQLECDAIVNAANAELSGGDGVDGAIHAAAGPELHAACLKLGGCPTGEARMTPGFKLKAKHVIHAVGPVWTGGGASEEALLRNAYYHALELADQNEIQTIAFPAISTGVYQYPLEHAAQVALSETFKFLAHFETIQKVIHVCFDEISFRIFKAEFEKLKAL